MRLFRPGSAEAERLGGCQCPGGGLCRASKGEDIHVATRHRGGPAWVTGHGHEQSDRTEAGAARDPRATAQLSAQLSAPPARSSSFSAA